MFYSDKEQDEIRKKRIKDVEDFVEKQAQHPVHARLVSASMTDTHYHVVLSIDPEFHASLIKQYNLDNEKQKQLIDTIFQRFEKSLTRQEHPDNIVKNNKEISFSIPKRRNDDWFDALMMHERIPQMVGALSRAYENILTDMIRDEFKAHNLSELADVIAKSTPGNFHSNQISVYSFVEHPDEVKDIEKRLDALGFRQLSLLTMGGMALIAHTNDHYVLRIVRKDKETERPLAPQILQPVAAFGTEHYRVEIMPKVNTKGVTDEHVDAVSIALETGWQNPGTRIFFEDGKARNVGLLEDGTPVVIDPGKSFIYNDDNPTPLLHEHYKRLIEERDFLASEMINIAKKFSWVDDRGGWKQHTFFPEILTHKACDVITREELETLKKSANPSDKWFAAQVEGDGGELPRYPNKIEIPPPEVDALSISHASIAHRAFQRVVP